MVYVFMIISFILGGLITQTIRMIVDSVKKYRTKKVEGEELNL